MMWLFAALAVLALAGIAVVASGRGDGLAPTYDDRPDATVPATGDLTADDLRRVRFTSAFRGYRMSEVDALLSRLATQVDQTDRKTGGSDTPEPGISPNRSDSPAD